MELKNFTLKSESDDSYHIASPSGKSFTVLKNKLSEKAHDEIKKLKNSSMKMDNGADVPMSAPSDQVNIAGQDPVNAKLNLDLPEGHSQPNIDAVYDRYVKGANASGTPIMSKEDYAKNLVQPSISLPSAPLPLVPDQPSKGIMNDNTPAIDRSPNSDSTPVSNLASISNVKINPLIKDPFQTFTEEQNKALSNEQNINEQFAKNIQQNSRPDPALVKQLKNLETPEQIRAKYMASDDNFFNYIKDHPTDVDHYWKNADGEISTSKKIQAGIALFLGAFSPHGNQAVPVIQSAIDRDIAAQRADTSDQYNLWKANREQLGSDLASNLAMRNQLLSIVQMQLHQAAANTNNAATIAKANLGSQAIQMQKNQNNLKQAFYMPNAQNTGGAPAGSEDAYMNFVRNMRVVDPEYSKELSSRVINGPNGGITDRVPTPQEQTSFRNYSNMSDLLDQAINLRNKAGAPGFILDRVSKNAGDSLQNAINSAYKPFLLDLKRQGGNDKQIEKLEDSIGDITSHDFFKGEKAKLEETKAIINTFLSNLQSSLKLKPWSSQSSNIQSSNINSIPQGYSVGMGSNGKPALIRKK